MAKKKVSTETVYINERFEKELNRLEDYPLAVLEAPMGYGKTAGLRNYLSRTGGQYLWMTAVPGSRKYFWEKFCGMLAGIDEQTGRILLENGFPESEEEVFQTADRISEMYADPPVMIVIDDYHVAGDEAMERFFAGIAAAGTHGIHFILSGRKQFYCRREELALKHQLLIIDEDILRMDPKDIRRYYSVCGLDLRYRQAVRLYEKTGGWAAALYLNLADGNRFDGFRMPGRVYDLLEQSVYRYLNEDEKDILSRVSVFRSFTMEQARFVRRKRDPQAVLKKLEENCGFLSRDKDSDLFRVNPLLNDYLRAMLENSDLKYRNEIFRNAADWFFLKHDYGRAAYAYYRSGHFEEMLSSFEKDAGRSLSGSDVPVMLSIFSACPASLIKKHPYAVMILARQLQMSEDEKRLEEVVGFLKDPAAEDHENDQFLGELKLLESFRYYTDLNKMTDAQGEAADLLGDTSITVLRNSIAAFGSPSFLYLACSVPGRLSEQTEYLKQHREKYYRVTDNNTRGSEVLLEAELEFYRGNMEQADILANKAVNLAERFQQTEVEINALFLHARISMLTGATEEGTVAMRRIRDLSSDSRLLRATCEMCEAQIYAIFNQLNPIAPWIAEGRYLNNDVPGVYPVVRDFLHIIYGKILLDRLNYTKYLGLSQMMIEEAERSGHLLTQICLWIYNALAYRKTNMPERSEEALRKAVALAMKDRLIIPFAENGGMAANLLKQTEFEGEEKTFAADCVRITERYERNLNVLLSEAGMSPLSMLTRREQEISLLVAEGKTNLQIARELNIAEITVKKSLSNIYARLGVSNRTSLLNKIK